MDFCSRYLAFCCFKFFFWLSFVRSFVRLGTAVMQIIISMCFLLPLHVTPFFYSLHSCLPFSPFHLFIFCSFGCSTFPLFHFIHRFWSFSHVFLRRWIRILYTATDIFFIFFPVVSSLQTHFWQKIFERKLLSSFRIRMNWRRLNVVRVALICHRTARAFKWENHERKLRRNGFVQNISELTYSKRSHLYRPISPNQNDKILLVFIIALQWY